jgi:Xaa-Pro aminopeptidase
MAKNNGFPRIPDSEFEARIAAVKGKMRERTIDLLVLYSNALDPGHVRYLADVAGINESVATVIPLEGDAIVCSGQACQVWSKHKSRVKDVHIFPELSEVVGSEYLVGDQFIFSNLFQELRQKHSINKIGTVGTLIFPQIIYAQLQKTFPEAEIVNAEPLMFELRLHKSANEVACIRKAAEILDESFTNAVQKIQVGWTELDIMAEIEAGILRGGAEGTAASWEPMIPSGPEHANLWMNRNTLRKVSAGEIICLQAGAVFEGYNAALCAPFVLGKIPGEIQSAVLAANEAMGAAIQSLKPGATSKQVNAAGKAVLKRTGFAQYSPYGIMHNIGCLECESPRMAEDKDFPVVEGMTVCIDVFLFRLPWGSFRIENTLAVTAHGADRLTKFNEKFVARHFA